MPGQNLTIQTPNKTGHSTVTKEKKMAEEKSIKKIVWLNANLKKNISGEMETETTQQKDRMVK